jgi:peptidoglycan/LPS O-acetylase OafA/YrhL
MGQGVHANWLDHMRLLFAAAVIFGHSFELVGQPDPVELVFHATNIGTLAVCGFFILSGYLIAAAWDRSPAWGVYLRNRLLRIAPAFVAAFLLSVIVAGALGSSDATAYYGSLDWRRLTTDLLTLGQPTARFPTAENYQVNGALWTIRLEFVCYLAAPVLLAHRWTAVAAWAICAALTILHPSASTALPVAFPRFLLMFLSGAMYWRLQPASNRLNFAACVACLPLLLLVPQLWAIGLATVGTYLLLSAALRPARGRWADVSYGTYLYGWPLQKLLILAGLTKPWLLFPISLGLALIFGAASWFLIERAALQLKGRLHADPHRKGLELT